MLRAMSPPPAIPRALERYPLGTELPGDVPRWEAKDRERGREVVVSRVPFGASRREERDAFVKDVRALYTVTSPALIAAYDAGAWDDDAFVVEERVIEPRPLAEAELDAREKALAARAIAEGVATLHDAGWTLDAIDVVIDAYRQPKIAALRSARRGAGDVAALRSIVETLVPGAIEGATAAAIAKNVRVPEPGPSTPLVHGAAPRGGTAWIAIVVIAIVVVAIVLVLSR
jgi:hypothetical protein